MSNETLTFHTVSYLVQDNKHPGAIITEEKAPKIGAEVAFAGMVFKIIDVVETVPPTNGFSFSHATCQYLRDEDSVSKN